MQAGTPSRTMSPIAGPDGSIVYVVDDDVAVRRGLTTLLRSVELHVETFASTEEFLQFVRPAVPSCLVLDVRLRGKNGLTFQQEIVNSGMHIPVVFMTGHGDIEMSVRAMKAGAMDFFSKPFRGQDMLDVIGQALGRDKVPARIGRRGPTVAQFVRNTLAERKRSAALRAGRPA